MRADERPGAVENPNAGQTQRRHGHEARLELGEARQHVEPEERRVSTPELRHRGSRREERGVEAERVPRVNDRAVRLAGGMGDHGHAAVAALGRAHATCGLARRHTGMLDRAARRRIGRALPRCCGELRRFGRNRV